MTFGEKLSDLRKKAGLSQQALSEKVGVARQTVSKWESGAAMPSTDNIHCLSQLYGVSVDYLLNDYVEEPQPVPTADQPETPAEVKKKHIGRIIAACLLVVGIVTALLIVKYFRKNTSMEEILGEDIAITTDDSFSFEW